jgi:hypothetical protein
MTLLAFPLEVGKTWNAIPVSSQIVGTVVARENVTVPAGTFDCYKVSMVTTSGSYSFTSTAWIGNNVGLVKSTSDYSTAETVLVSKNF